MCHITSGKGLTPAVSM